MEKLTVMASLTRV